MSYRLEAPPGKGDAGYVIWSRAPNSWGVPPYNLILVFDEQNVLRAHSLVLVKAH